MIWWWPTSSADANSFASQANPLLITLTGTLGDKFQWTVSGNRPQQSSTASSVQTYVVKLPPADVVAVVNRVALSVGFDGAGLLFDKFKLFKPDFESIIEGESSSSLSL